MPEPTRYKTSNSQPPHDGFPSSRMYVAAPVAQAPQCTPDTSPPNGGLPPHRGHAPPTYVPQGGFASMAFLPDYQPYPAPYPVPVPYPVAAGPVYWPVLMAPAPPPAPAPAQDRYEPPGQWVDGQQLTGNGWSYLAPKEHVTVNFVGDGARPCDFDDFPMRFNFTTHKVACIMTVSELIDRLGGPDRPETGVTEILKVGNNRWVSGDSYTRGGGAGERTLGQVGWNGQRGEVWLVVKR